MYFLCFLCAPNCSPSPPQKVIRESGGAREEAASSATQGTTNSPSPLCSSHGHSQNLGSPSWVTFSFVVFVSGARPGAPRGSAWQHCSPVFATSRALGSHSRAEHGDRLGIGCYLPNSTCPCCGTDFRDRLRCIAHSSEKRLTRCSGWVLAHCAPIDDQAELQRLDWNFWNLKWENGRGG